MADPIARAEAELAAEMERTGFAQPAADSSPEPQSQEPDLSQYQQQPPAAQPPQEDYNSETYKARWETSQGIIRSQSEQLKQVMDQNRQLLDKLETFIAERQTPAAAPQTQADYDRDSLVNEFGSEMVDAMEKAAEAKWANRVARLEERLSGLEPLSEQVSQVASKQTQNESESFKMRLSGVVPGWEQIMKSPQFVNWATGNRETFSGKTYAELFDAANNSWNLNGIVAVFNAFTGGTPQTQQAPPPTPSPDPRMAHVAPGRTGGGSTPDSSQQPVAVSEQAYLKACDDYRRGSITDADYAKIERAFFNQNAGR